MAEKDAPQMPHNHPIMRAAIDHFNPSEYLFIDVEEWKDPSGNPYRIYFKKWTLKDKAWFEKVAVKDGEGFEAYAELIIKKAVDEHGNNLFDFTHRAVILEQVDEVVVTAICDRMRTARSPKDHLKN